MLPYLVSAIAGAMFAQRGRPAVANQKKTALGPRSGVTYKVDDFTAAGLVLVKAPDGTVASFRRVKKGFEYVNGVGDARVLEVIKRDFLP